MNIKIDFSPKDYQVGALIARFHVDELHHGHKELINYVCNNHKKVIIFLGVKKIQGSRKNPLDFATRKAMIQKDYPAVTILPLPDQRYDTVWSRNLDSQVSIPYGDVPAVLYGSRDSFIPHYTGKYKTVELETSVEYNGTAVREEISREVGETQDFRRGVIHAIYALRPITYPTVDICAYNDKGQILLAKKPNEPLFRFVGGFVDTTDETLEKAAKREFREETGGNCEIGGLRYITSRKINDWRYAKEESGIISTLFLAPYSFGTVAPSDDIAHLEWVNANQFSNYDGIRTKIMPEHREMMADLMKVVYSENIIPKLGPKLDEVEGVTYTIE